MKSSMMKMTAAAALVLGMASAAHAVSNVQVVMSASVDETTCDLTTSKGGVVPAAFGNFTQAEMFDFKANPKESGPVVLLTDKCAGANIATNGTVKLVADGYSAADGSAGAYFGDVTKDIGYGFDIQVSPTYATAVTDWSAGAASTLAPKTDSAVIATYTGTAAATTVELPTITITPRLAAFAAAKTDILEGSALTSVVNLKLAYN